MVSNTKKIALNGILGALTVICLLLAAILPTTKLSLYAFSSFFVSIIIMEYKVAAGWAFYIATNLVAFIVVPDKIRIIPYTVFFGLYGIIKYYTERIKNAPLEYILKYLYFNLCLAAAVFLVEKLFLVSENIKLPLWAAVIIFQFVFLLYDYAYTLFIKYYISRLRRIIKNENSSN
ncbi:MAG TPA: hypothetical protein PK733_06135 [Clostridiales bacterium]|nr:hypothetical protein [Clostridiales bacterium]